MEHLLITPETTCWSKYSNLCQAARQERAFDGCDTRGVSPSHVRILGNSPRTRPPMLKPASGVVSHKVKNKSEKFVKKETYGSLCRAPR